MDFEQELIAQVVSAGKRYETNQRIASYRAGTLEQESIHAEMIQMYFHTVGFVAAERAFYNRCEVTSLRQELAEGLYEEETGKISKTYPHLELYTRMAASWGLDPERIKRRAYICPEMAAVVNWYMYAATCLSSIEALTVLNFCAEGQNASVQGRRGRSGQMAEAFRTAYHKTGDAVLFYDVHDSADQEHFAIAARNLSRLAATEEEQERVRAAMRITYDAWGRYGAALSSLKLDDCWKASAGLLYK